MRNRITLLAGGAATGALVAAFVAMRAIAIASTDSQDFTMVEKGRYLAIVADCASCHIGPGGKSFAGGRSIETPFGNIVASNITPEQETGIGSWTDDDFDNAVRRGIRPDGARLY